MELTLNRKWLTEVSTVGELLVDGRFECWTLEDRYRPPPAPKVPRETCIPSGRYQVIINNSVRFGREPTTPGKRASVVIAEVSADDSKHLVGVMVNAVSEVVELPPSAIEPPPSFGASIRDAFIAGIARHKDQFLVVLDVAKVLSVEELSSLDGQRTSH